MNQPKQEPQTHEPKVVLPAPLPRLPMAPPQRRFVEAKRTQNVGCISSGQLLDTVKLDDIAKQVDSTANLDDSVKDALVCYIDEYMQMIIEKSAEVARHRGSRRLEHKDVAFTLKNYFNMADLAMQSLTAAGSALVQ